MMDKFNEFYMMQNQAKKLEQGGLEDKALALYLKIIEEYLPNNDFSFDRATTLLEKKFKYAEALAVCEKALALITAGDIQGDADKFQLKIDRIRQKAQKNTEFQVDIDIKEPEVFHFGIPGFRTTNRLIMILGSTYYALAAFAAYPDQLYTFLFLFAMAFVGSFGAELMSKLAGSKPSTKALAVTLIALVIAGYSLTQVPQVKVYWETSGLQQAEGTGDGTGTEPPPVDTDRVPPEIPEKYLEAAAKSAQKHPAAEQAFMTVDSGKILVDLIVKPGSSKDSIEEISAEMINTLGGLMVSENLKGPTDTSFGELYTFYSVAIQVVDTLEQTVDEGTLSRSAAEIIWTTP